MTRLLELFIQDEQINKKKQIIGSIANERSLRLFKDEGAKKPYTKLLKQPVTMRLDHDTVT